MARIVDLRKGGAAPTAPKPKTPRRAPETPSREPKRTTPLRVRKRRRRYLVALAGLVSVGALLYGVHWASYLPQYSISEIQVTGTVVQSPDDIRGRIDSFFDSRRSFISPRSIFRYRGNAIEQYLETDILHIAHAEVTHPYLFSNELDVRIDERMPFARWCAADQQCYLIDQTGFVFAPDAVDIQTPEALVFYGGVSDPGNPLGHSVAAARFPSALALTRTLGQAGFAPKDVSIDSDTDLTIRLRDSFAVRASFGSDPNSLVRDLKLILGSDTLKGHEAELEYVDLRFGNRVFYKLKGQEAVGE